MTREEAIRILASSCIPGSKQTEALETLIPELAESEDERIRKWLVGYFSTINETIWIHLDITCEQILAYLEKQKAKEKQDRMMPVYNDRDSFESALDKAWKSYNESGARTVDGCEDDYVECAHAKGFREGYLFGIEKQKENPKSADSIPSDCMSVAKCEDRDSNYGVFPEDVIVVARACEKLEAHGYPELAHALKNVNLYTKEQKPVDYDHEMWKNCSANFEGGKKEVIEHPEKYGLQKPAEWSEEDADILNCCISSIEEAKENRYAYKETDGDTSYDREIAWLKSLRPSWKPSEEHLSALLAVFNDPNNIGSQTCQLALTDLYEQLKKL